MPVLSFAQTAPAVLVPCNNNATTITDSSGNQIAPVPCDFNALMVLINNIINFILYGMVIPIAAILFAYAGFELVTSGGSTEKRGIAKKVFTNVVIGLVIAMSCWLIVKLVLGILGYTGTWVPF